MIEVHCNGKVVKGFTSVNVTMSLDQFAASYSLEVFNEENSSAWLPIFPGDNVEIVVDGEVVIDGYNIATTPSLTNSGTRCQVIGSEKTCDLVDCPSKTLNFENKKVDEIVRLICNDFDVRFDGSSGADVGSPLKKFSADAGQTAFNTIVNACKLRNLYPISDGKGIVSLIGSFNDSAEVDIVQGVNVLSANGNFSVANRFSKYTVFAAKDATGKTFACVTDDEMTRKREFVLLDERFATKENCEARAIWEAKHRQAMGNSVSVVVDGWRQKKGGKLWKPGLVVNVDIPTIIGESRSYLVNKVSFSFGGSGTQTSLELVDEDIYLPAPKIAPKGKVVKAKKDTWESVRKQTGSKLR